MITLFTDLDGTFIPEDKDSRESLLKLKDLWIEKKIDIVYVTGRDLLNTIKGIRDNNLPMVKTIVCDVGTSIYNLEGGKYTGSREYSLKLEGITPEPLKSGIINSLTSLDGVTLQEESNQKRFKNSFYYELDSMPEIVVPDHRWKAIISRDSNRGFIDIVPNGVSKLYAIKWILENSKITRYIFAGDSGNDLEVFNTGFPSVVVGNSNVKRVLEHQSNVYISSLNYTTGVLDGLNHYLSK